MDILMVAAELSPYARASRVGDSVAALAKALCQLEHRVTLAVPRYPGFEALLAARRLTPLDVGGGRSVTVLDGQLPAGPTVVLFDAPGLFDRAGIYGDESGDYADNAERFGLLCAAGAALARGRAAKNEPFDVVHVHDWPVAPLVLDGDLPAATVLTLHDGGHRFVVPPERARELGVDVASGGALREAGGVSLVAAAARRADAVAAPSPTVAADLRDPSRFGALAAALGARAAGAAGILGGLDYAVWNPATDAALRARYDAEDPANKASTKSELEKRAGLEVAIERPLLVFLVEDQAGASLTLEVVPELFRSDVAVLVAIRGDARGAAERLSAGLEKDERLAVEILADDAAARRACAAADFVVLPSEYEVTATWARAAQRYGALPIARATGAHVDAIVDCDAGLETGTGFLFDEGTRESLQGALGRALSAFTAARFPQVRRRVMRLDLAWDRPARRYVQVYRQAVAERARVAST